MRRSLDAASAHAERMRQAIEACEIPHVSSPKDNVITVSAGVAVVDGDGLGSPLFAAIRTADEALLRAKREGRNRVVTAS
jgi:diguanylate cyclase (GGDEF)-like protein